MTVGGCVSQAARLALVNFDVEMPLKPESLNARTSCVTALGPIFPGLEGGGGPSMISLGCFRRLEYDGVRLFRNHVFPGTQPAA